MYVACSRRLRIENAKDCCFSIPKVTIKYEFSNRKAQRRHRHVLKSCLKQAIRRIQCTPHAKCSQGLRQQRTERNGMRPNFPNSEIEFADCMLKLSEEANEKRVLGKEKKSCMRIQ